MKIFSTFLFLLLFFTPLLEAQIVVPDYRVYKSMTPAQISEYRQRIWDTLPAAVGWVNDFGDLFTPEQEQALERELEHFEKATSVEICIVTLDSNMVAEKRFDEFSYRLMKIWGIGKIAKSNGVVICICKDYRRLCVTTDFGIDKLISESEKAKMINKQFIPYFTKNLYYDGTTVGLNALLTHINKKWNKSVEDSALLLK